MTPKALRAVAEIARLLSADPACAGRVTSGTVDAIAALVAAPGAEIADEAKALVERLREARGKANPALLAVRPAILAKLLQAGAQSQKPIARDVREGAFDPYADAEYLCAAIALAESDLIERLIAPPELVGPVADGEVERAFRAGWGDAYDWCEDSGVTESWEAETKAWARFAALRPAPADLARKVEIAREGRFKIGDRVQKITGSSWRGTVVGTYSTSLTPEGYAVESTTEHGSVQIYPAAALESRP